jgi:hypothetical protein
MPTSAPVERPLLELEDFVVAKDEDSFAELEDAEEEDAPVMVWYAVIVVSMPVPHA